MDWAAIDQPDRDGPAGFGVAQKAIAVAVIWPVNPGLNNRYWRPSINQAFGSVMV
jgi:hypothetical protein